MAKKWSKGAERHTSEKNAFPRPVTQAFVDFYGKKNTHDFESHLCLAYGKLLN